MLSFLYNIFIILGNAFYSLTTSQTTIKNDKEYIDKLISNANFNMTEVRKNTELALMGNTNDYSHITSYFAGNAWFNYKLSYGWTFDDLCDIDIKIYNAINNTVLKVKPLSYPITLFHGFEPFAEYNEHRWQIGQTIIFPWFLSKTTSYDVALKFASSLY